MGEPDLVEVTEEMILKFGAEAVPGCACFGMDEDGAMDVTGLRFIADAMRMSQAILGRYAETGVCPRAAPHMLAIMVHTAVFEVAAERSPASIVSEMETVHDEVAAVLRHLRNRPRVLTEGVAGAC